MNKRYALLIATTLFISACASSRPACGVGQGLNCTSVTDVNQAINQGYSGDAQKLSSSPKAKKLKLAQIDGYEQSIPGRSNELWVKVWVPAQIDEADNYHPQTSYYTVIKQPQWQIDNE